jgi:hypothetical protein
MKLKNDLVKILNNMPFKHKKVSNKISEAKLLVPMKGKGAKKVF